MMSTDKGGEDDLKSPFVFCSAPCPVPILVNEYTKKICNAIVKPLRYG